MRGDVSLACLGDIKKADLLRQTPQSVLIGKLGRRYLWLNSARRILLIAPARSGKTTSMTIPVLCTYQDSMVVLDLDSNLRKLTSGRRRQLGQCIYAWAPYDEEGRTHRFNPMTLLNGMEAEKRVGEIQTIAAILYPEEPGKDPFWSLQSRAAFTAFTSFMFERWDNQLANSAPGQDRPDPNTSEDFPSLERVLRFSSGIDNQSTKNILQTILKNPQQYPYISSQTRTAFDNLAGLAEQSFSSVIATMQAPLQQFLDPILAAATNATDFDVTGIRRQPTTIYVDIPTEKLDDSDKLLNIFFSTVISNNLTKQLCDDPDLKHQVLLLMDEFTTMGRMDVWARRIPISANYGVRDLCIIQSRAQLREIYGDSDAQNFITNHDAQIVFTPSDQSDANEYSEMIGYQIVRKEHRSPGSGRSSSQITITYSEERRALMSPQEIKELPNDEELIFKEGCKPIRAKKNWYFRDKQLKEWTRLAPVVIEPLAKREEIRDECSARVFTCDDSIKPARQTTEEMKA